MLLCMLPRCIVERTDPETCRALGAQSLAIISRWGFAEDLAGLRQALRAVGGGT